ncbi:MAG: Ig-like domain-containing protein [Candidatus Aenigmatarchaeota archaeon]
MRHFHLDAGNNLLALLAVMLMAVSCVNISIAFSFINARHALPEGMATSSGLVMACASVIPRIEGATYHVLVQGTPYYYDFNATGENESIVVFGDNSTLFNITAGSGAVNFTPVNDDVGLHYFYVNATETLCSMSNSTYVLFNVTDFNDPPFLVAIMIFNSTGNHTYPFPINTTIYLYEDSWYNLSLVADDPDLHNEEFHEVLTYGKIPPTLFVLNESTGNVTFMPLQVDVNLYNFRFHVFDNQSEVDQSSWTLLRVLNVNDNPVLQNKTTLIGGLGAMTADWGMEFTYDMNATDEDGDAPSFHVDFLSCEKLNASDSNCTIFGVDEATGRILFTPPFGDVGNYTVNYSATDGNGGVDWYVGSFGVTEWENEPPNITRWEPEGYNVTMFEGEEAYFTVNVSDDYGIPFAAWYRDSALTDTYGMCHGYQSNYTFSASYEDSGVYNITVKVSDGQYIVAHEWRLIVLDVAITSEQPRTSWGNAPPFVCTENWRCTAFSDCARDGTQMRVCLDLSNCSTSFSMPNGISYCMYTPNPDCYDGIKNCHGGLCEIVTDCGGPCPCLSHLL